jgi:TonB family protein
MMGGNLLAWSFQIAALVAIAAAAAGLLRLRVPAARLLHWQMALLACFALPLVRPWKHEVITDNITVSTVALGRPVASSGGLHVPLDRLVLWLLAVGILARAIWLAAGFLRLRLYRRRSQPLDRRDGADLLVCDDISRPVTFGVFRPVVLLPAAFPALDPRTREAILCHELLHVRRRDWIFTVAEELVRTVLWFHPAIWWLLGQIQLAREQAVDRQVVDTTRARDEYLDALLAIAGARPQLDLAPAPLFLRQRHLKQRVISLLQEVRMSKTRLVSSMAASVGMLAAACWMITAAVPLAAAPDSDSPGVTVELNGATLLHRPPIVYSEAVRTRGIQGRVAVQVYIDARGNVADAQVLSGPEELRRAVLESVLEWHFNADAASSTRQLTVVFQTLPGMTRAVATPPAVAGPVSGRIVKSINISGLSGQARSDLLSRLPVHEGETLSPETLRQLVQTVHNFDEHLSVTAVPSNGDATVLIGLAPPPPPPPLAGPVTITPSGPIRVGGNVQSIKLISKPVPKYPAEAKQARIQGQVKLVAIIAKDGTVRDLTVISGHPLLVPAALEAVRQWVYSPTLLNGVPTEVETEIDVNFTLAQ